MEMVAAVGIGCIALYLLLGGYRFARTAISLWGFVAGFLLGGTIASDVLNVGFLDTKRSIFLGIAIGIISSILAYMYYGAAVVVLAGGIGYWLGSGFLLLLGFVPGTFSSIGGLVIGILCAFITRLVEVKRYALITLTSLAGSVLFIGAVLVMLRKFNLEGLSYIAVGIGVTSSWLWLMVAIAFTAIGISIQTLTTSEYECEKWAIGGHKQGGV